MAERVGLVDYGAGNLHSVRNALMAAGATGIEVTDDPRMIARVDRIILPGVGAFAACMNALTAIPGMIETLNDAVRRNGRPFLGVCVGMQLMAESGEECGTTTGLGWVRGAVRAIVPRDGVKVPHMGWNDVSPAGPHALIETGEAYFLHGYAYEGEDVIATTQHGGRLAAAVGRDNMLGVQFHPEKSQRYGLDLLSRFLSWRP